MSEQDQFWGRRGQHIRSVHGCTRLFQLNLASFWPPQQRRAKPDAAASRSRWPFLRARPGAVLSTSGNSVLGLRSLLLYPDCTGEETGTELPWWSGSAPHGHPLLPLPLGAVSGPAAPDSHADAPTHAHAAPGGREEGRGPSPRLVGAPGDKDRRQSVTVLGPEIQACLLVSLPRGSLQERPQPQQNHGAETSGPFGQGWPADRSWTQGGLPS